MAYKHDYDKILTRLTTILKRLNDGEALSIKDLAEEFNVSTRTIQRDFNERLISFPITQINKKWQMEDGFKIEKSADVEDSVVLDIIEKITEGIGGKFATKSNKLLGKIKNKEYNPIYTKLNIEDISDKLKEIQLLESAIKEKKIVSCNYKLADKVYDLSLKPLKIANYEGFWYLISLDSRNDRLKKYYLKDITNIKVTDDIFITDTKLDRLLEKSISVWFQKDVEPFAVKLFANEIATKFFKRRPIPTQSIESLSEDGTMEFIVKITHEMEILPIVKYWIPHLQVIEPSWIRDIIKDDLEKYLSELKNI
ncbi:MAG: WYL domain-containing transcriptional regulator [Campylobacterota bacterium]|nr:WYL domain-containing transcriptional regulator [Campylobacterota bacterium]